MSLPDTVILGQFFAQEVTLGGMLVSTRVIEAKETTEEERTKEAFKTAIGLSITTVSATKQPRCVYYDVADGFTFNIAN